MKYHWQVPCNAHKYPYRKEDKEVYGKIKKFMVIGLLKNNGEACFGGAMTNYLASSQIKCS